MTPVEAEDSLAVHGALAAGGVNEVTGVVEADPQ